MRIQIKEMLLTAVSVLPAALVIGLTCFFLSSAEKHDVSGKEYETESVSEFSEEGGKEKEESGEKTPVAAPEPSAGTEMERQTEQICVTVKRLPFYIDLEEMQEYEPLKWGDHAEILDEAEDYYLIRFEEKSGYVRKDCVVSAGEQKVIVIDAGHQAKANLEEEPIGPGADETKIRVSGGTSGNGKMEYELTLDISLLLEKKLKEYGYHVVMVRRTNDVNISNSERSRIANEIEADALVRIHANGSENDSIHGAQTICIGKDNPYPAVEEYENSKRLSECILESYTEETGFLSEGVKERNDLSGINWCEVPVTVVEMGYMTNDEENALMCDIEFQEKMVTGIADGIRQYFEECLSENLSQ